MSGTAGETKESECRTKGLACVLDPFQSLSTELWNLALLKNWLGFLRANYLSLITPHRIVKKRWRPEVRVEGSLTRFDFRGFYCYITN